jgi:lysophospholipase L1-like esterase
VQKYFRPISIVIICVVMIALGVGLTLAQSDSKSPANSLFNSSAFSVFDSKKQTSQQKSKPIIYAALGDSVAAGSGLVPVKNATPTDKTCARSQLSYPPLIAAQLHAKLLFAACGSATTLDIPSSQSINGKRITPQLDTAFTWGTPDLFTITLGANDMEWIQSILKCYEGECGTDADSAAVDQRIVTYRKNLHTALTDIYKRSGSKTPQVILTGYYSFGSPECLASLLPDNISEAEAVWFDQQTQKLADATTVVAQQFNNTAYVSLDATNHGLCASNANRWVQNLKEPGAFHLTASGEKAMADAISKKIQVRQ